MATSASVIAHCGDDLNESLVTLEAVLAAARAVVDTPGIDCVHEIAASDYMNLAKAVDIADEHDEVEGADRVDVLWPVFVFAHHLVYSPEPGTALLYAREEPPSFWKRLFGRPSDTSPAECALDAARVAVNAGDALFKGM